MSILVSGRKNERGSKELMMISRLNLQCVQAGRGALRFAGKYGARIYPGSAG